MEVVLPSALPIGDRTIRPELDWGTIGDRFCDFRNLGEWFALKLDTPTWLIWFSVPEIETYG
jgi:hypothetical protein